jgi:nucleoside-diphosphate-sugar epimerase/lipopolysaccharide/colanic/teichoic acid biosynthesis glycosyltransferase
MERLAICITALFVQISFVLGIIKNKRLATALATNPIQKPRQKSMFLISGATGFVGKAVAQALLAAGQPVVAAVRQLPSSTPLQHTNLHCYAVGKVNNQTDWQPSLREVHTVVHCAARAHVMRDYTADVLAAYREVNVAGTLHLAHQAAAAGVRRFVFISSIGVNGNQSAKPLTEADAPHPQDAYGVSKLEAEQALMAMAARTGMEVVIIRPPLVYGPAVPGNFARLVLWVQSGVPLPLGAVHNRRSLVALDNLVNFVLLCADRTRSPQAANQVFLVADGEDVSTTTLLRKVAQAAGLPSRLLPVPAWLLRAGASLLGKRALAERLLGNLQVDATKARTLLGWRPVVTMHQQLAAMFPAQASPHTTGDIYSRPVLRLLDVIFAATGLLVLWPVLLLVCIMGWFDTRSPIFLQERVGRYQRPFVLVKFRTMRLGTEHMPSHLASSASITRLGALLRRTKLDELPQLWNVLLGQMSLVGPRPGLYNHHELTEARAAYGVYVARPGITGLAQVSGIDMSTPDLLAQTDARMLRELNLSKYLKFILLTVFGKGSGDRVRIK